MIACDPEKKGTNIRCDNGVVGGQNIRDDAIEERLKGFAAENKVVGRRKDLSSLFRLLVAESELTINDEMR